MSYTNNTYIFLLSENALSEIHPEMKLFTESHKAHPENKYRYQVDKKTMQLVFPNRGNKMVTLKW